MARRKAKPVTKRRYPSRMLGDGVVQVVDVRAYGGGLRVAYCPDALHMTHGLTRSIWIIPGTVDMGRL